MFFNLSNGKTPRFEGNKIPEHLRKYEVPHSQAYYTAFNEGELLSMVILGNDFSIWSHYFFIKEPVMLHPTSAERILALLFMLQGNIPCELHGHGPVTLLHNRFQLFYVPKRVTNSAFFEPGNYRCIHINFHPDHLVPVSLQYPAFHPFLQQSQQQFEQGTPGESHVITPFIKTLVEEMVDCRWGIAECSLFIESRIRDLLRMYVREHTKSHVAELNERENKLLVKLKDFIGANLDSDLSVDKIATKLHTSRSTLQHLCKRKFGKGIHELVTEIRMEEAKLLLAFTNKQIGEIAAEVSPLSFSSFSAAFIKYVRQSPRDYRRMFGHNQQK